MQLYEYRPKPEIEILPKYFDVKICFPGNSAGCDLVGFHIEDYCVNFLDCCQRILGCRVDRKKMIVEHHRRGVRVKALPIGIPYDRFEMLAKNAPKVFTNDGVKVSSAKTGIIKSIT